MAVGFNLKFIIFQATIILQNFSIESSCDPNDRLEMFLTKKLYYLLCWTA